jgi:hypothetical protein
MVFRTLWRQEGTWQRLLEAERAATSQQRTLAEQAQQDAHVAREEADLLRLKMARLIRHLQAQGIDLPDDLLI